jgi:hypothetical protein
LEEQKIKSINKTIQNILIAFEGINAPLTINNLQCSNVVVTNLQAVLKLLNEEDKKDKNIKPENK